jgi:hypothetical protein
MKYQQPYGVSDPNAPYINGNPSTGTMGSIPPAASIEYPQREIVNLIADAGLTPADTDLHQLAKGVQSGRLIYGDDIGAVNQVSLAVSPPVTALQKGMQFITIFAHDNTGPASASISGLPFVEIVHPSDRTSLQPLDLRGGAIGCFAYDGSKFQLAWAQTPIGAPVFLTAPLNYYAGGAGASDLNDGTTATVSGIHGPFATLQKAMDTIANFNLNGHDISVHVAAGTYQAVRLGSVAGSGSVIWTGNPAIPANCLIVGTNASAILAQNCGGAHVFNGFAVQTSGTSPVDPLCGITVTGTGAVLQFNDIQYNTCAGSHIAVAQNAVAAPGGKQIINGSAQGGVPLMPSGWHAWCFSGGIVQSPTGAPPVLTITGAFGGGNGGGFIQANVLSYTGLVYGSMTGAANWSGYKYSVNANSIMTNNGSGVNYYPGSVAGVAANGGQYY